MFMEETTTDINILPTETLHGGHRQLHMGMEALRPMDTILIHRTAITVTQAHQSSPIWSGKVIRVKFDIHRIEAVGRPFVLIRTTMRITTPMKWAGLLPPVVMASGPHLPRPNKRSS